MPTKRGGRATQDATRSAAKLTAPAFITPMAAHAVSTLPIGDDWIYEIKLDGYRALILKDGNSVRVRSRNNKDLTRMYPSITAVGRRLKADRAVIDGEIV